MSKTDSNNRVNDEKVKKVFVGGLPQNCTEGMVRLMGRYAVRVLQ